jgi:GT2 family glycosyltransferase
MGKIPCYGFEHNDVRFIIVPSSHCYLSTSKNRGVNSFSGCENKIQKITDCESVIFVDADHSFNPKNIDRLVASPYDIVGAAYWYRQGPTDCLVAGTMRDDGYLTTRLLSTVVGLHRVDWVGGGFVAVKSTVFERLEYPWFRRGVIDNGNEAVELGEDIGFCLQAKRAGIQVWVDCDNVIGHGR